MAFFDNLLAMPALEPEGEPDVSFRSRDQREVLSMLRELRDAAGVVSLASPEGHSLSAKLLTVDETGQRIAFDVEHGDPRLPGVVEANEATAVAYLAAVKLQFELRDLVLVHGDRATSLQARMPQQVYRFQRRSAFRVRTLARGAPTAQLRHPSLPDMQLTLRIADISLTGCALLLPDDVPPLQPGSVINGVRLELDADTALQLSLRIQHVSSGLTPAAGQRLGCEILQRDGNGERLLQRYIDQTQKRRRLLSLD